MLKTAIKVSKMLCYFKLIARMVLFATVDNRSNLYTTKILFPDLEFGTFMSINKRNGIKMVEPRRKCQVIRIYK